MSTYDGLMECCKNAPLEQKLAIVRAQMITPVATIRGFAAILGQIDRQKSDKLPDDFEYCVAAIKDAGDELKAIVDWVRDSWPKDQQG